MAEVPSNALVPHDRVDGILSEVTVIDGALFSVFAAVATYFAVHDRRADMACTLWAGLLFGYALLTFKQSRRRKALEAASKLNPPTRLPPSSKAKQSRPTITRQAEMDMDEPQGDDNDDEEVEEEEEEEEEGDFDEGGGEGAMNANGRNETAGSNPAFSAAHRPWPPHRAAAVPSLAVRGSASSSSSPSSTTTSPFSFRAALSTSCARVVEARSRTAYAEYRLVVCVPAHLGGGGADGAAGAGEGVVKWEVWRRFSEFSRLRAKLKSSGALAAKPAAAAPPGWAPSGWAPPPLPPKTMRRKLDARYLEERRLQLDKFLAVLLQHPRVRADKDLRLFLRFTPAPLPAHSLRALWQQQQPKQAEAASGGGGGLALERNGSGESGKASASPSARGNAHASARNGAAAAALSPTLRTPTTTTTTTPPRPSPVTPAHSQAPSSTGSATTTTTTPLSSHASKAAASPSSPGLPPLQTQPGAQAPPFRLSSSGSGAEAQEASTQATAAAAAAAGPASSPSLSPASAPGSTGAGAGAGAGTSAEWDAVDAAVLQAGRDIWSMDERLGPMYTDARTSHEFSVRGANYLADRVKADPGPGVCKLVTARVYVPNGSPEDGDRIDHACSKGKLAQVVRKVGDLTAKFREPNEPALWVVNIQIPGPPTVCLCMLFALPCRLLSRSTSPRDPPAAAAGGAGAGSGSPLPPVSGAADEVEGKFLRMWQRYYEDLPCRGWDDPPHPNALEASPELGMCPLDHFRNQRFKMLPRIVDGPWVVKTTVPAKPALLGQKITQRYFRGECYVETCCHVGSSVVANNITGICRGASTRIVVDIGFCIEGRHEDELPEKLFAAIRWINFDPDVHELIEDTPG